MSEINFIPDAFFRARARRRMIARSGVLLVAVAATMAAWQLLSPARHHPELDRYLSALDEQIAAEKRERAERADRDARRRRASALLAMRDRLEPPLPVTSVVAIIAEEMPAPMGLTRLSLVGAPAVPELTSPDEPPEIDARDASGEAAPLRLTLEGLAPDDVILARFIGRLDRQPLFDNVELGFSRPAEAGDLIAREFQITAVIPLDREFVLAAEEKGADAR